MFITKKHIPRRTFLRGVGVTLALPLLDSMIPAQTPLSKTAAVGKTRFTGIFVPQGLAPGYWIPEGSVLDAKKLPSIMEPLAPFVDQTVILSGMWSKSAEPPPGVTGADHWVAAAFLAGEKPKKTTGSDIHDGVTIDQIIANQIGQESLLPSLQLAIEDPGANSSNCGEGYSCAYTNSISWAATNLPLPMELNPQVVFERLFGDVQAKTPQERAARREQDRSILDSMTEELASFKRGLPTERSAACGRLRRQRARNRAAAGVANKATGSMENHEGIVVPAGVPDSFDEHIKLQFDLQARLIKADITRVSTVLYARDLTGRSFPASGTNTSFHGGSHHAENPDRIMDYSKINRYHVQCLAYYPGQAQEHAGRRRHAAGSHPGALRHQHGRLQPAPALRRPAHPGGRRGGTTQRRASPPVPDQDSDHGAILLLSVLDMYGVHQDRIGDDSTGLLAGLAV